MSDSAKRDDALWIEVRQPLPDALRLLASCVEAESQSLPGASIALSERGTLLLNQQAWELCRKLLSGLPDLKTKESTLENLKPIRFLLVPNE
jgi:hypothetical protein